MSHDFLDQQKKLFDQYGADFEFSKTKASIYEFNQFVKFIGESLDGKRILDLGCGTGRFGIQLAEITSAEVIGVDISDVSLEVANTHAKMLGVTNFIAIHSDFKDNKYDSYFDYIVCINMLHHTDEQSLIAENIYKSLKTGGAWIIIENNPINPLFIPFFILIGQLKAHLNLQYFKSNIYSLRSLVNRHKFQISEIKRYGFLPTMLYNYSSIFIFINKLLNRVPLVNQFTAFHLIKAIKR